MSLLTGRIFLRPTSSHVKVMLAVQYGINTNACEPLFAFAAAKGLSYFCSHCCKVGFLHFMQVDLKTVPLLLTQKDISNLFDYRVAENRFYVTNLIPGIVKTSSLSNKRWKSHNVCDSRTGTAIV